MPMDITEIMAIPLIIIAMLFVTYANNGSTVSNASLCSCGHSGGNDKNVDHCNHG